MPATPRAVITSIFLVIACVGAARANAAVPGRLNDRALVALVERIDAGWTRFEATLDDRERRAIVRGQPGDPTVARSLEDWRARLADLKERLASADAANPEAAAVLSQASALDTVLRREPPRPEAARAWSRLALDLTPLALAYGTRFPLPQDAIVGRVSDRDLARTAGGAATAAVRLGALLADELPYDRRVDERMRDVVMSEVEHLRVAANDLRDQLGDGHSGTQEAARLLAQGARVETVLAGCDAPESKAVWGRIAAALTAVAAAYGVA